jgi:hypothetical protein
MDCFYNVLHETIHAVAELSKKKRTRVSQTSVAEAMCEAVSCRHCLSEHFFCPCLEDKPCPAVPAGRVPQTNVVGTSGGAVSGRQTLSECSGKPCPTDKRCRNNW